LEKILRLRQVRLGSAQDDKIIMQHHISFDLQFTTNTYPGRYYAVEGIDGSGKTTQVQKLAEYFEAQGKEVFITKEPTNGIIGNLIHQVLSEKIAMPAVSLQYLFCADRGVHLEQTIIPALKEGKVILSDRSLWSAVAYGIADLGLSQNEKERILVAYNLLSMYGGFLIPDKTILLKVPVETALERVDTRGQELTIYEKKEKLEKIEKEYEWLAGKFGECITMVDGDHEKTVEEVFALVVGSL
jgi:dTMP kinase